MDYLTAIWQQIKPNIVRYLPFLLEKTVIKNVSSYMSCKEELKANPLTIFVSYDKNDAPAVQELVDKLKATYQGLTFFFDRESVIKDVSRDDIQGWEPILQDALHSFDCAMICLTPESIHNKRYFRKIEVHFIVHKAKMEREGKMGQEVDPYVIFVKLAECTTPHYCDGFLVSELYVEDDYVKFVDTVVSAYKQLKDKRGIKPFQLDLNIFSPF